jgi:general stress protein 26
MTKDEKLGKLREIVKAVDFCMLATMASHKVDEIGWVSKVNASFADIHNNQFASISGRAKVVRDRVFVLRA